LMRPPPALIASAAVILFPDSCPFSFECLPSWYAATPARAEQATIRTEAINVFMAERIILSDLR
jgi:hypothetical protein